MAGMPAVKQGEFLEGTGLFRKVSWDEARPGDYGYRHWKHPHRGVDLGDAFIVAGRDQSGDILGANGANRRAFVVPPDGGRYRGLTFLRPTEEFYRRYGHQVLAERLRPEQSGA
jgi:hypothetical protein